MKDDRAREGIEHAQQAALQLIAAARAFLDVAEDLVREPGALGHLVESVARVATAAAAEATTWAQPPPPPPGEADGGVQRIRVS